MTAPGDTPLPTPGRLTTRLWAARAVIAWERAWPALWPTLGAVGAFIGLGLFDILPLLPGWLHGVVVAAFAITVAVATWRVVRDFRLPGAEAAARRLERDSGLSHRPLQAVTDSLASGTSDPVAVALWRMHQQRMAAVLHRLRVGWPSPRLGLRDPMAIRIALFLALLIGTVAAGPDAGERLVRAARPDVAALGAAVPPRLEIWITPPAYTGLAPVFPKVAAPDGGTLTVPAGSALSAQVSGGGGRSELVVGTVRQPFEVVDDHNGRVRMSLDKSVTVAIEQGGRRLGSWSVTVSPDGPPTIEFDPDPTATERGTLRVSMAAADDYGLESVVLEMRRTYEKGGIVGNEVIELSLPLPSLNPKQAKETSYHDFAPHAWAGFPVALRLRAKDAAGQIGYSREAKLSLPEREFRHPVARAIIEQRKRLTSEPEKRRDIARALEGIARAADAYNNDTVTFLALAMGRSRLIHEPTDAALPPVRDLLWDTALRVEDGKLSIAERELRRLQDALMKALSENAPDAEIERLVRELQQALDRFMQSLAEQLRNTPEDQIPNLDPRAQIMNSTDLQRMLDQIRDLMRSGARDAARELLAQLRNMLENLRAGRPMRGQMGEGPGGEMMRQLQELARRQSQLLDQTFRQSQGRAPNSRGQTQQGAMSQRELQDALRQLQQMMGQMGNMGQDGQGPNPGQALDRAGQFMGRAGDALERGSPGDAIGPQGQALDQLQQAGRAMMQQMMNQFARDSGIGMDRRFNPLNQRRDPLGRHVQGEDGMDTGDVKIPDENQVERVQQIIEELYRRAGQRYRPQIELDYINRLLQRF
jgi:uncharacterized protein (TIGR02302 family)